MAGADTPDARPPKDADALGPIPGIGYGRPVTDRQFLRLSDSGAADERASVAEEVPVAFVYSGRAHAVMMATPADLEAAERVAAPATLGTLADLFNRKK